MIHRLKTINILLLVFFIKSEINNIDTIEFILILEVNNMKSYINKNSYVKIINNYLFDYDKVIFQR